MAWTPGALGPVAPEDTDAFTKWNEGGKTLLQKSKGYNPNDSSTHLSRDETNTLNNWLVKSGTGTGSSTAGVMANLNSQYNKPNAPGSAPIQSAYGGQPAPTTTPTMQSYSPPGLQGTPNGPINSAYAPPLQGTNIPKPPMPQQSMPQQPQSPVYGANPSNPYNATMPSNNPVTDAIKQNKSNNLSNLYQVYSGFQR
jgi:hypothetical protein